MVLTLLDGRDVIRGKRGRGKAILKMPLPGDQNTNILSHLYPKYVSLTTYENCYWINDEPIRKYSRPNTPHAQLICPECRSALRLSAEQAMRILEAYGERGSFDIHKAITR